MPRRVSALGALALLAVESWLGASNVGQLPAYLLVLYRATDDGPLLAAGLTRVAHVPEPGGQAWFTVLQK